MLVVVLIIGILAAVALPQYRKSVQNSRLAQWDVMLNTGVKAIEDYLLVNSGDFPENSVYFTGTNRIGSIEMPGNCDISPTACYTSAGSVSIRCVSSCYIEVYGMYNEDGTRDNKSLDKARFLLVIDSSGQWSFQDLSKAPACRFAASHPNIPVISYLYTICESFGVTLPNPEYEE